MKTDHPARPSQQHRTVLAIWLLVALAVAALPSGSAFAAPAAAPPPAVSMETIHVSYLDLTGNIADLRTRIVSWKDGDEGSLNIAVEKLDRIQVVLGSVAWPPVLVPAIEKTRAAVEPMLMILQAKDRAMAEPGAAAFGDASHDLTHDFYGEWLPAVNGGPVTSMAPHAAYLDLSANIADLRSRVAAWKDGDEGSLNIAKEKVDRISILVTHMSGFGVLAKPLAAISEALPTVASALESKDAAGAEAALKAVADASHNLTHDFYNWVNITAGPHDADCIQASYLDLSLNLSDLRMRIGEWQKGDENGLNIAKEKLDRIEAILGHTRWTDSLATAIAAIRTAIEPLRPALEQKGLALAEQALKPVSDASHDLTHAYYGNWLATAHTTGHAQGMGNMPMAPSKNAAPAPSSGVQDESKPHGHGNVPTATTATGNRGLVLSGFGAVNALIVVAAIFTRSRKNQSAKAKAAPHVESGPEGASE